MARRRSYNRSAPLYHRIPIIPGILYINISRSGLSISFGKSDVGRATVSSRGVRVNKSIGGVLSSLNNALSQKGDRAILASSITVKYNCSLFIKLEGISLGITEICNSSVNMNPSENI